MSLLNIFLKHLGGSNKNKEFKTLYEEVDILIEKFMISEGNVPPNLKIEGVINSLKKMFNKEFFDICTIKDCAEILDLKLSEKRILFYRTQHCLYWKDMEPDFRDALIVMVLDDFRPKLNLTEEKKICIEIV